MRPESAKYLQDMLEAVETIEHHVGGRSGAEYAQLRWLRDAVTWNFCVVGEALSQLTRVDEEISQRITDGGKIIGLRIKCTLTRGFLGI